jgi:hypothetical protein
VFRSRAMMARVPQAARSALMAILLAITAAAGAAVSASAQWESVIDRARPSVVLISFTDVLGRRGHGSGFVYAPSGIVITNHHVIEGATDVEVTIPGRGTYPAAVLDYVRHEEYQGDQLTADTDVAVLRTDVSELPVLPLGNSTSLRQGQELLVLGYPGGVSTDSVTASRGIVSALHPGWIQTDAAIEPGESGGPVLDSRGVVVGIATFVSGRLRRIGGIVPITAAREIAQAVLVPGGRPRHEVVVTGMEYQWLPILPRRKLYRRLYSSPTQQTSRDSTSERVITRDVNGAILSTYRDSAGSEADYYCDAEGCFAVGGRGNGWTYTYPQPAFVLPFPPLPGRTWPIAFFSENSQLGLRSQVTGLAEIVSDNEDVAVPAGQFSHVLEIREARDEELSGARSGVRRSHTTAWLAPHVGLIRRVLEISPTQERIVDELLGFEY